MLAVSSNFYNLATLLPVVVSKTTGWVENSADPNQKPRSVASDLDLQCLLMPVFMNTSNKYAIPNKPHLHIFSVTLNTKDLGKM